MENIKPESWQEIAREAHQKMINLILPWINQDIVASITQPIFNIIFAAIERSHAEQPQAKVQYLEDTEGRQYAWLPPNEQPQPSKAETDVTDKIWSKIVTETGDMERADRVTSGKDTPSRFELLRPDQPSGSGRTTDDKQEWFYHAEFGDRFHVYFGSVTVGGVIVNTERQAKAICDAHNAVLAAERQRRGRAEKEHREWLDAYEQEALEHEARIKGLGQQLLSALAAIEQMDGPIREAVYLLREKKLYQEGVFLGAFWGQCKESLADLSALREHDAEVIRRTLSNCEAQLNEEIAKHKPLLQAWKLTLNRHEHKHCDCLAKYDALAKVKP